MIANKYKIHSLLGTGGSANVFLAYDVQGNKYAIKVMRDSNKYSKTLSLAMMEKEYQTMMILNQHPNILSAIEYFVDEPAIMASKVSNESDSVEFSENKTKLKFQKENINCLVLEYAEKGSVCKLLRKNGGLGEYVSCFLFNQIVNAIYYMHQNDIAHCDIKPQNILLDSYYNAKVADFGTVEAIKGKESLISNRKGTWRYMAPELLPLDSFEPYDPKKSDIYALGITLFSMITGELDLEVPSSENFETSDTHKLTRIDEDSKSQKIWNIEDYTLSQEVTDLIKGMLSQDPAQRPSIEEVANHFWLVEGIKHITPSQVYVDLINLN